MTKQNRTSILLAASVLVAGSLLSASAVAAPGRPLVPIQVDSATGPGVWEDGLWKVPLADGSDIHTHGPDAPPARTAASLEATSESVICVPASEKHFEVILARASDDTDRSASLIEPLRQAVYDASSFMDSEAKSVSPTAQARYRVLCDGSGEVTVHNVVLPTSKTLDNFSSIAGDLRAAGFRSSIAKYLVYYDDCAGTGCSSGGQGSINNDDRASANNWNNVGPDYAVDYGEALDIAVLSGPDWHTLLHESGHNMGAVQLTAPHSSGYSDTLKNGHHCNDGWDVMCYGDGGDKSSYSPLVCLSERFDCNKDDYFNPSPPSGSYLATHWNLAGSYNEFLYPKAVTGKGGGKTKR